MEDKKMPDAVPYIAYEGAMARNERLIRRLICCIILALFLLAVSNAFWLYEWTRYDYADTEVTVDSADGGNANFIGNDGDITNGKGSCEKAYKEEKGR